MTKVYYFLFFIVISLAFSGCFYDNKEDLFQLDDECDIENVTYSLVVQPILEKRCYGCHSIENRNSLGAGINLEEFSSLSLSVGNIDGGQFLKSIQHDPAASPMPKGSAKIPDCEIMQIEKWVENGALED